MASQVNRSRRAFLRGRLRPPEPAVRLPWVASEDIFLEGCTRCNACIQACPEKIIVRGEGGFPEIDFNREGCTFCQACIETCPEPLFVDPDSSPPWLHRVEIQESCLGYQGVFCQSCKESCEAGAIRFALAERRIPVPDIDPDVCTGCGACVSVCPVRAVSLKPEPAPLTEPA